MSPDEKLFRPPLPRPLHTLVVKQVQVRSHCLLYHSHDESPLVDGLKSGPGGSCPTTWGCTAPRPPAAREDFARVLLEECARCDTKTAGPPAADAGSASRTSGPALGGRSNRAVAKSGIGISPTPFSLFTGQTFGKGD